MDASTLKYEETEDNITLHGLGFLQIKLQAKQRLHIWHPDLPRRKCFAHSSIHDHRFGFTSLVLIGEQINTIFNVYEMNRLEKSDVTHIGYLHEGERTSFGNRPWIPHLDLLVITQRVDKIPAGGSYVMERYVYHSTTPGGSGKVATIMTKADENLKGAHSLCEVGIEPDINFDRKQWPAERLWEIVRDVLGGA